jgi:hypothetical protein
MSSMPAKMRRSKFSLKTNQASIEVSTRSVFSNNEADEAETLLLPIGDENHVADLLDREVRRRLFSRHIAGDDALVGKSNRRL